MPMFRMVCLAALFVASVQCSEPIAPEERCSVVLPPTVESIQLLSEANCQSASNANLELQWVGDSRLTYQAQYFDTAQWTTVDVTAIDLTTAAPLTGGQFDQFFQVRIFNIPASDEYAFRVRSLRVGCEGPSEWVQLNDLPMVWLPMVPDTLSASCATGMSSVTLDWNGGPADITITGDNPVDPQEDVRSPHTVTVPPGDYSYEIQLDSASACEGESNDSATGSFSITQALSPTQIDSASLTATPAMGDRETYGPDLSWPATTPAAPEGYEIELFYQTCGGVPVCGWPRITTASQIAVVAGTLTQPGFYFWRVRALPFDGCSVGTTVSDCRSFEVTAGAAPLVSEVSAGGEHTCVRFDDGGIRCFGDQEFGQLGTGDPESVGDEACELPDQATKLALPTGVTTVQDLDAGGYHTCVVAGAPGAVYCFGANQHGQLGVGTTMNAGRATSDLGDALVAVDLAGDEAAQVSVGAWHSCARTTTGTVKCWGRNHVGQLGQDSTDSLGDDGGETAGLVAVNVGGATVASVVSGNNHTCILSDTGAVRCWGGGSRGRLGQGSTDNLGDAAGEMAALVDVDLGATVVTQLAAGDFHTCALSDTNTLYCWGDNSFGQLGYGDTTIRGDEPGEMGASLPAVASGVDEVAAGDTFTCARFTNDTVRCWGRAQSTGVLGQESSETLGDEASETVLMIPPIDFGDAGTVGTPTGLSAGGSHACALFSDNGVRCWGANTQGQLGQGDVSARGDSPGEMGLNLAAVPVGF